jgi:hypothetical protein
MGQSNPRISTKYDCIFHATCCQDDKRPTVELSDCIDRRHQPLFGASRTPMDAVPPGAQIGGIVALAGEYQYTPRLGIPE